MGVAWPTQEELWTNWSLYQDLTSSNHQSRFRKLFVVDVDIHCRLFFGKKIKVFVIVSIVLIDEVNVK